MLLMEPGVEIAAVGHAGNPPGHGPYMRLYLWFHGGVVKEVKAETYPCPVSERCGAALCGLVKGCSIEKAWTVDYATLLQAADPVPMSKRHCVDLALEALAEALDQLEALVRKSFEKSEATEDRQKGGIRI